MQTSAWVLKLELPKRADETPFANGSNGPKPLPALCEQPDAIPPGALTTARAAGTASLLVAAGSTTALDAQAALSVNAYGRGDHLAAFVVNYAFAV